ncbi:MAG: YkgJ family cysteine cluster protein [Sulfurimonas sp.]|nr:YkgJ family cysteine cluster protein [Sulfurimonas sp.]
MARLLLDPKKHKNYAFNGCVTCDAKCCGSNIVYSSIFDLKEASALFPILFYISDGRISPVYFFYYGEATEEKCPYLNGNLCSVYERRPYACRSYPFSFEQGKPCFDDGCPRVGRLENGGNPLFNSQNKLDSRVISEFVGETFAKEKEKIFASSKQFVDFCLSNNFLVPYTSFYKDNSLYMNFKPTLVEHLYMLHPQRIGVMRMQNKELFTGHDDFFQYIMMIIASHKNIETLFSLKKV